MGGEVLEVGEISFISHVKLAIVDSLDSGYGLMVTGEGNASDLIFQRSIFLLQPLDSNLPVM